MANNLIVESNDTENGYIYKELTSRLDILEKSIEDVNDSLSKISTDGISVDSLTNLTSMINACAKIELLNTHMNNMELHISSVKRDEWDNKYEKDIGGIPETDLANSIIQKINNNANAGFIKHVQTVGDNMHREFAITHGLQTKTFLINIRDTITDEIVHTDVSVIDANTIKISFNNVPQSNQYEVFLAR